MNNEKNFWVIDKNNVKCYIGDVIKCKNNFIGEIIKVPSSTSAVSTLKIKFDFGEVPLSVVCLENDFEKINNK